MIIVVARDRDRKMSTPTKVCSDVEGKSQAEEHDRIIKVDARRSDAAEIKRRRPRKNQGAPKMPDPKTKERRQRSGGMLFDMLAFCAFG